MVALHDWLWVYNVALQAVIWEKDKQVAHRQAVKVAAVGAVWAHGYEWAALDNA